MEGGGSLSTRTGDRAVTTILTSESDVRESPSEVVEETVGLFDDYNIRMGDRDNHS